METINGRVSALFDIFIDRAADVRDAQAEDDFNERLQSFVADIERDQGSNLTAIDCAVLYGVFELLQDIAAAWRQM